MSAAHAIDRGPVELLTMDGRDEAFASPVRIVKDHRRSLPPRFPRSFNRVCVCVPFGLVVAASKGIDIMFCEARFATISVP